MSSRCRTDCRRGDPRRRPNGGIAAMIAVTLALGLGVAAAGPANAAQGKVAGGPSHCPPGLAKKGCVPPGQAKKWQGGQILPADLPYSVIRDYRQPPPGAVYVRADNEVLLIGAATRRILEIISD